MRVREYGARLWRLWQEFWFAPTDPLPFAAFRICFAITLFVMDLLRHFDLSEHYTDAGVVPAAHALEIMPDLFRPMLSLVPLVSGHPWLVHGILLGSIVLLLFGVGGRWTISVTLLLHLAFMQRNVSVVYGADMVAAHWLFFLLLGGGGMQVASLSRWWRNRRTQGKQQTLPGEQGWTANVMQTVGVRLLQIQLCLIYGYTGMEKLKGAQWWDGSAVWAVLNNNQIMATDLSWMRNFPFVIGIMTHSAVLFEIYFPALIWVRPLRKWVLAYGALLHGIIALILGLYFFSGMMMAAYLLFISGAALRSAYKRCGGQVRT